MQSTVVIVIIIVIVRAININEPQPLDSPSRSIKNRDNMSEYGQNIADESQLLTSTSKKPIAYVYEQWENAKLGLMNAK
jgi:hypothetical protein